MPDNPKWLSVEQREWTASGDYPSPQQLVAHAAEADRREAELREQLAAKDTEIAAAAETLRLSQLQYKLVTERAEHSERENERLRAALKAEVHCQTCDGTGVMGGNCEGCAENGYPQKECGYCHGTGRWEDSCAECDGTKQSIRSDLAREALAATPPAKEGK